MRKKALFIGDVIFQFKYGFYFIYIAFSVLYISLLFTLPDSWRKTAGILMIFTDPAAMGLYFMGSIVLLEKSERVLNSIVISPVKPSEYVLSKLSSIALISTLVAVVIGFSSGIVENIIWFIVSVYFCSCLFSSIGLIIAAKISTLNSFIIYTIPAELLINIPSMAWLFGYKKSWLLFHPGVCMIELCLNGPNKLLALVVLILWTTLFTLLANYTVRKMLQSVGGVKL